MKNKFYFFDSEALKHFQKRIFFSITIFVFVFFIAFYRITDVMILSKSSGFIGFIFVDDIFNVGICKILCPMEKSFSIKFSESIKGLVISIFIFFY